MSVLDIIKSRRGLLASFAALFVFAMKNTLVYSSGEYTHPLLISVWNSASVIFLSVICLALKRFTTTDQIDRTSFCYIAITGSIKGLADVALTSANVFATPADAIAVLNTSPIFTIIFSIVFLRARCRWTDALVTILAITGVAFVTRPPFLLRLFGDSAEHETYSTLHMLGIILALVSSALAGLSLVFGHYIGYVRNTISPLLIVLFIGLSEFLVGILASSAFNVWTAPETILDAVKLAGVGAFGFVGLNALFYAVSSERATVVAIIMACEVAIMYFVQQLVFDIPAEVTGAIGAVLIVTASVGISLEPADQRVQDRDPEGSEEETEQHQPLMDHCGESNK